VRFHHFIIDGAERGRCERHNAAVPNFSRFSFAVPSPPEQTQRTAAECEEYVWFTPESGHVRYNHECPLWANRGHQDIFSIFNFKRKKVLTCSVKRPLGPKM